MHLVGARVRLEFAVQPVCVRDVFMNLVSQCRGFTPQRLARHGARTWVLCLTCNLISLVQEDA